MRTIRVGLLAIAISLGACDGGDGLVQLAAKIEVRPNPIVVPATALGLEARVEIVIGSLGDIRLEVSSIAIEGTDEWTISSPAVPFGIEPKAETAVGIIYKPTGAPAPAFLLVRSSDESNSLVRIPIETSLEEPGALELCVAGADFAEVCTTSNATLDLGLVGIGEERAATVTLKNDGGTSVVVQRLSLDANASPALELPAIVEPFNLAPDGQIGRSLRFLPLAPGNFQGTIQVEPRDPEVIGPTITVTAHVAAPDALCVSPLTLDFGTVTLGASSVASLDLSACGGGNVEVQSLGISATDFSLVDPFSPMTLEPISGAERSVSIRFTPTAVGRARETLTVVSDAGSVVVNLVGATTGMGTLDCNDGTTGVSWLDSLPTLALAVSPGPTLPASSGVPAATCTGDPTIITDPSLTQDVRSALAHNSGHWYYEATVEEFTAGWSKLGVYASPADVWYLQALFMDGISAAGISPQGQSVVSVLLDLDSATTWFYVDGVFDSQAQVLVLPGTGAFHAGGVAMIGNKIRFNYGAEAFAYGVPAGFEAWSSGPAAAGACLSDADVPAPAAPIEVRCDANTLCADAGTIETNSREPTELIILGLYEAGSMSSWRWGTDGMGNPVIVPVGPGQNGDALVEIDRPGPIRLVLSAYEPTDWTVVVGPMTDLVSVSIYGMHLQSVTGLDAAIPVDIHTICTGGDGGNCPGATGESFAIAPHHWPFDVGGGDTQGFVDEMEARFCLPLKLFGGAYSARRYIVH